MVSNKAESEGASGRAWPTDARALQQRNAEEPPNRAGSSSHSGRAYGAAAIDCVFEGVVKDSERESKLSDALARTWPERGPKALHPLHEEFSGPGHP